MKNEKLRVNSKKYKFEKIGGITLISLVITIVVLIILASIGIYLSLGNNGIFTRAKQAKETTNKQTATEIINLKITTAQMNKYAENQRMPTLKELSVVLGTDNEIQYVTEKSQIASTKYEVGENPSSIYTKLNQYPYEFEINGQLQLASIDGVKLATGNSNATLPIGNSVNENSTETYLHAEEITMTGTGTVKKGLSGTSKFGTIDDNGILTIDESGLYFVSSNSIFSSDSGSGQIYNIITANNIELNRSMTASGELTMSVSATFYANKGDKLDVFLRHYNEAKKTRAWKILIYKIY